MTSSSATSSRAALKFFTYLFRASRAAEDLSPAGEHGASEKSAEGCGTESSLSRTPPSRERSAPRRPLSRHCSIQRKPPLKCRTLLHPHSALSQCAASAITRSVRPFERLGDAVIHAALRLGAMPRTRVAQARASPAGRCACTQSTRPLKIRSLPAQPRRCRPARADLAACLAGQSRRRPPMSSIEARFAVCADAVGHLSGTIQWVRSVARARPAPSATRA